MQFSIGDILSILDKTLLNPLISVPATAAIKFLSYKNFRLLQNDRWLQYMLRARLPPLLNKGLIFVGIGVLLRTTRYLNRRALNNGLDVIFDWQNEIVVITGAAGGIGAATAQKLAARGTCVVVIDVIPLTFPKPKNLHYYRCDLMDFEAVQETAALIKMEVGHPTCVVANAGICRGKPLLDASQRDIELTFGVNTFGLIWTIKAFLPYMVAKNHGHCLIVASQTGHIATAGVVDYAASKSAALAIYEGIHTEVKHLYKAPAVRISCISPSAVDTKMFDGAKGMSNFFSPRLSPDDVAQSIVDILWEGKSQNVMIPAAAYVALATKLLPEFMRTGMQDAAADAMTALNPHKPLD